MDISRRAHDEPCRFFNDNDRVDTAAFLEALPNAPAFPGWSLVYPAQNDPIDWPYDGIGTLNQRPFKTTLAKCPKGLLFDHFCGTKEQMESGAKYEPDKPPQPIGADGLPLCCTPPPLMRGGAAVAGRAAVSTKQPLVKRSGAGVSGRAVYSVTTTNDATAGGMQLGGSAGDVLTFVDPTAGGLEIGGETGDGNGPHGELVFDTPGNYTFTAVRSGTHTIEGIGAGGGGGGACYAGAGAGAYAFTTAILALGDACPVHVGAPGGGPIAVDGEASSFAAPSLSVLMQANGGGHASVGFGGAGIPGVGGTGGVGLLFNAGGDGGHNVIGGAGGGGGGGGDPAGIGQPGSPPLGMAGGAGGQGGGGPFGVAGRGGDGGIVGASGGPAQDNVHGAGGGGGGFGMTTGGTGGRGWVRVRW